MGRKAWRTSWRTPKKAGADRRAAVQLHAPERQRLQIRKEIKQTFEKAEMKLDGVSAIARFWVHTTAWTGSPTIRPFIPADVAKQTARTNRKMGGRLPAQALWIFAPNWALKSARCSGAWLSAGNWPPVIRGVSGRAATTISLKEGQERFVKKTEQTSRNSANSLGIYLCHEIHPGTAAMCADDFNMLVKICDGDQMPGG